MQQHGNNYFARRHPDPADGATLSKFTFFRTWSHCYINLEEIRKCSSKVANICPGMPTPSPRPWGWDQKVKIKLFQNMVMLHIKIKENHECSNVVAIILPAAPPPPTPPTPPTLWMGSVGKKSVFSTWPCYLSN